MSEGATKKTSGTDWKRLASMKDDEIDYSDIPPLKDAFFERAVLRIPGAQAQNWVELDPDVIRWFQAQGEGYKTRIISVLREHMRTHGG
jgi:uncharacterized protein (DUF4415 family)